MDELANPYRPGAGTLPPALVGRDDVLGRFAVVLRMALSGRPGRSLVPVGLRGAGKTVLLSRFVDMADEEGFAVGCIELPGPGTFPLQLAARLRRILLELDQGQCSPVVKRATRILKTFALRQPDGAELAIEVDALYGHGDSGDLTEDVIDLIVATGEAARACGRGVLLAVDDAHHLEEHELAALISAAHRSTQSDLPLVVALAGLPQLPALVGASRPFASLLFTFIELGPLTSADAGAALEIPALSAGVQWSDSARARVVAETQGYPYLLQEWGYQVWNLVEGPKIHQSDVERVIPQILAYLDRGYFGERVDRLSPSERQYLRAMAELGPGPHRSGSIAAQLNVNVTVAAPRRSSLAAKGMIYTPSHGQTAFTIPLFDEHLRRTIPA